MPASDISGGDLLGRGRLQRVPTDHLAVGERRQLEMIEAAMGDTLPPRGNRGNWCFDEAGQLSQATKVVYDLVAKPIHGHKHAIIATSSQGLSCDNHHCAIGKGGHECPMDVELLKKLLAERPKETQAALARLVGITPDKMSKTLAGKRALRLEEANILRAYFGLDKPKEAPVMLPIVGLVSAGAWREGFENIMGHMPSPDRSLSSDSFVVIVEGDSMDLVAQPGEGIIVDPRDCDLVTGRYYVVRNADGETTFKQYKDNPARLEPCSSNSEHQTIYPGREQFTVVGRARKRVSDL